MMAIKLLLIIPLFAELFVFSDQEKRVLVMNLDLRGFNINGANIFDLSNPSEGFTRLKSLGELSDSTYENHFAYEKWVFTYNGLVLTYIDRDGSPELSSMTIVPSLLKSSLIIQDIAIDGKTSAMRLLDDQENRKTEKGKTKVKDSRGKKDMQKFDGAFHYMEIFFNEKKDIINKIEFIVKND